MSPSPLLSQIVSTPLGAMQAVFSARGLCLLDFVDRPTTAREIAAVERHFGAAAVAGRSPWLEPLECELDEYFAGNRQQFDVPMDWVGTAFERAVWQELMRIGYGELRSYAQQAAALGRPSAVRAVAAANGRNKISIIVPCHRVIGSNGQLTGYGGGLERKRRLIELEARHAAAAPLAGAAPSVSHSHSQELAA